MSYIENIKSKIGKYHFNNRLKKLKRQVNTHNLKTAQTAGILFNSPDKDSFEDVKGFLSYLSENNLKVIALGYIPAKKIPEHFLMRKGINFYCKKDINWYNKPKNGVIEEFINQEFDILFDLSTRIYPTVNYVGTLSKASFKVGKLCKNSYQDLTIDISKNNSVAYLIEQIKHYLNLLNN